MAKPLVLTAGGLTESSGDLDLGGQKLVPHMNPTGYTYANYDRSVSSDVDNATALVSGQERMELIWLPAGYTVTNILFLIGSTAMSGGSHAWHALHDSSRALLGQSTDVTSPTGATGNKSYALATPYVTTYAGFHYLGICYVATVMPSLVGPLSTITTLKNRPPIVSGQSSSGLTGTAPNPAAALTVSGIRAFCGVS